MEKKLRRRSGKKKNHRRESVGGFGKFLDIRRREDLYMGREQGHEGYGTYGARQQLPQESQTPPLPLLLHLSLSISPLIQQAIYKDRQIEKNGIKASFFIFFNKDTISSLLFYSLSVSVSVSISISNLVIINVNLNLI